MSEHMGQHFDCSACDAEANRNSAEGIRRAAERSQRSAAARAEALKRGLSQSVADRAGSYAADGDNDTETAILKAIEVTR